MFAFDLFKGLVVPMNDVFPAHCMCLITVLECEWVRFLVYRAATKLSVANCDWFYCAWLRLKLELEAVVIQN